MATTGSPLRGRTAVVTGAARGVGEAMARSLADRGARVALLGLEEDRLAWIRDSLPGESWHWMVDISDDAGMARAAAEVRERLGAPSVVVANAGVAEGGPFAESDPATWRRVVEVNLIGSAITARSFLPALFDTQGYFLQIASLASIGAVPMMSAYCASKAGVESFAHSLRAEVAHRRVGVGIAYLNWTATDMLRDGDEHAVLRELRGHMPPPARKVHPVEHVADRLVSAVNGAGRSSTSPPGCGRPSSCGPPYHPSSHCCRGGSFRVSASTGSRPPAFWERAAGPASRAPNGHPADARRIPCQRRSAVRPLRRAGSSSPGPGPPWARVAAPLVFGHGGPVPRGARHPASARDRTRTVLPYLLRPHLLRQPPVWAELRRVPACIGPSAAVGRRLTAKQSGDRPHRPGGAARRRRARWAGDK